MTVPSTSGDASGSQRGWSVEAVRRAERACGDALTDGTLMQRAARALADHVAALRRERTGDESTVLVILVGPGNNGGDALHAAAMLAQTGVHPTVVRCVEQVHEGGLAAARAAGLTVLDGGTAEAVAAVSDAQIIVDGILGIGATPRPNSPWDHLVEAVPPEAHVLAVDVPTPGLSADETLTFGAIKSSLLVGPWAGGRVTVADIGLPPDALDAPETQVLSVQELAAMWPVPGPRDHKYTRGVVGFATGSQAFPGAAVLGTVAAVSAGTGMVRYVGADKPADAVLAAVPEAVHGEGRVQAWVVGSGIDGPAEREHDSERYASGMRALGAEVPVVVDAGALSWLGENGVRPAGAATVLTPHAGELATFLQARGVDVDRATIEADPLTWARRAADETGYTVLLKGGVSIIAEPDETTVLVENRAPAWLATAGTGDVLAGVVGVLLAAGLPSGRAAALAAYVHGASAAQANPGGPVRAPQVAQNLGETIARVLTLHR